MVTILSRSRLKRLARLIAGLLLFTQMVFSAQACMLPSLDSMHAFFNNTMMNEACDGVSMDQSTCIAHCLKADQASAPIDYHFHAMPPSVSTVAALPAPRQVDSSKPSPSTCRSGGPPLQILFCSFQT
jgi:hypothetical protein